MVVTIRFKFTSVHKDYIMQDLLKAVVAIKSLCLPWQLERKDIVCLPVKKKKFTLIRSPFIFGSSREPFECRIHSLIFSFKFKCKNKDQILLLEQILKKKIFSTKSYFKIFRHSYQNRY